MNDFPSFFESSGSNNLRMKRYFQRLFISLPPERLWLVTSHVSLLREPEVPSREESCTKWQWESLECYATRPFQERGKASPQWPYTCAKYSSEILPAHSMQRSRGRHGLATSAHLIIMRLIRIWFSGKFFPIGLHSQSLPSFWKTLPDEG